MPPGSLPGGNTLNTTTLDQVRELVLRYGWNTTCFQLVNPRLQHWFAPECVVGYVQKAGYAVVAGAPVCDLEFLPVALDQFESFCRSQGLRTCYFGAEQRLRDVTAARNGYSRVVLGAQPLWSPAQIVDNASRSASLRAQMNRCINKGVRVEEWPVERATGNAELSAILDEWLSGRGLPPMHFLVEPDTLHHLEGRRVFVAIRNHHPVAFLGLSPIPQRNGWLTEQFPRRNDAPNGTVDLLMVRAADALRLGGASLVTMGIVPLATRAHDATADNPGWLRLMTKWARAHGRRFYNFEGLEWFKEKFLPDQWEPIYAISNEPRFTARTLYAISYAFTDSPPLSVVARGILRAALAGVHPGKPRMDGNASPLRDPQ